MQGLTTNEFRISPQQRKYWGLLGKAPGLWAQATLAIEGALEAPLLLQCLQQVLDRHPILSSRYPVKPFAQEPALVIGPAGAPQGGIYSLTHLGPEEQRNHIRATLARREYPAFAQGVVLSSYLFQLAPRSWVWALQLPSLVADSRSLGRILLEATDSYRRGGVPAEPGDAVPYTQFSEWQNGLQQAPEEEAADFWAAYHFNHRPRLSLTGQSAAGNPSRGPYEMLTLRVPPEMLDLLHGKARQFQVEPAVVLQACLHALLFKRTTLADTLVGYVSNARAFAELEATIGLLSKVIPVAVRVDTHTKIEALVEQIARTNAEVVFWQDSFFGEPDAPGLAGQYPQWSAGFEYVDLQSGIPGTEALSFRVERFLSITDQFDWLLYCLHLPEGLQIEFCFESSRWEADAARRLMNQYGQLLENILAGAITVGEASMLSGAERELVLQFRGLPAKTEPVDLMARFDAQAARTPGAAAVACGAGSLTYQALQEQADRLAYYLTSACQVTAGTTVGVLLEPSERMIIALLGVLKAGAAFVPLSLTAPRKRMEYVVTHAGVRVLLIESTDMAAVDFFDGQLVALDVQLDALAACPRQWSLPVHPQDLAYVMYTSGSTGRPKGVEVSRRSLSNYVDWASAYYFDAEAGNNFAVFTALTFDLTLTSVFTPLIRGDQLTVFPAGEAGNTLLAVFGEDSPVSCVKLTPSHLLLLAQLPVTRTAVRTVILGGEALQAEHVQIVKRLNPNARIFNEYGPTETTVACTAAEITDPARPITIGKPISNTELYILDERLALLPLGTEGEICVAGYGLALGYRREEALTAARFVPNPYDPPRKMYRTGDRGRWEPDGSISFAGRAEDEVKIRGNRVNLGEIESVLRLHPGITDAVVVSRETGVQESPLQLYAYLQGTRPALPVDWYAYLAAYLPAYMIPVQFVHLDAFPLTSHGKVDRTGLRDLEPEPDKHNYLAPGSELETALVSIWETVLGRSPIGIKDNFFEIGGHSLNATQIAVRIQQELSLVVQLQQLFDCQTIESLAAVISGAGPVSYVPIPASSGLAHYPLSHAQKQLWILSQREEASVAYNITAAFAVEGILDKTFLDQAFEALLKRHESLRTSFAEIAGEPRQKILDPAALDFRVEYAERQETEDWLQAVDALAKAAAATAFDLTKGPLLKAKLLPAGGRRSVLLLSIHHIVFDGWSMQILVRDLVGFYNGLVAGQLHSPKPLRVQYKDYAIWHNELLSSAAMEVHRQYWHQQLKGPIPVLPLLTDYPRPATKTYQGASVEGMLDSGVVGRLTERSGPYNASLFMVLLTSVKAFFYRYTGQNDIAVGVPVSGRSHKDLEDQIGFYLNTVVVRSRLASTESFLSLLPKVKKTTLEAFAHQVYPFDRLVDDLEPETNPGHFPLFDVMVAMQSPLSPANVPGHVAQLSVQALALPNRVSKFDLTFLFTETDQGIRLDLEYSTDLFEETTVLLLKDQYFKLLETIAHDAGQPLLTLAMEAATDGTPDYQPFQFS